MSFNINEIRSQLSLGGARPALFQVQVTNPITQAGDLKLPFLCHASSIPAWSVGTIEVPYFGRKIKVAGTRQFEAWTVTVMNDEDFLIRDAMETWSNAINSLEGNLNTTGGSEPNNYKSQATVTQFSKTGEVIRTYQFNGIWPAMISGIELDWDAGDKIEEFQVTFNFDDFEILNGPTGDSGGK